MPGYDYTLAGFYFATIVTLNREPLLGHIINGEMKLNDCGLAVDQVWNDLPRRYSTVQLDAFCIMPNHFHFVIEIQSVGELQAAPRDGDQEGAASSAPTPTPDANQWGAASSAPTLGSIIRTFKSLSAIGINRLLGRSGTQVWQRYYYERIVRNEREFNAIREYILNNPLNWLSDPEYP